MGYAKIVLIIGLALFALPAMADTNKWKSVGGLFPSGAFFEGGQYRVAAEGATGTTRIVNLGGCGDDSTAEVGSASGATLVTQTCKETGSNADCENDLDAGSAIAGDFAHLRKGPFVRFTYSGATAGEFFYVGCAK